MNLSANWECSNIIRKGVPGFPHLGKCLLAIFAPWPPSALHQCEPCTCQGFWVLEKNLGKTWARLDSLKKKLYMAINAIFPCNVKKASRKYPFKIFELYFLKSGCGTRKKSPVTALVLQC
ncbi:unnamed protein product [Meganyctiphanes norvegica]|uniref:Uncharacterized protein n=1 Tax=Meganyctiphanes norvegica TaxID=48144 RepID=A0AAV2SDU8_MEGNR